MPPRGGTAMPATGERTSAPALPEFIANDLYGSLIATAIALGGEVLAQRSHADGRAPSVADQVAQQMVERAGVQLRSYHRLPDEQPAQS